MTQIKFFRPVNALANFCVLSENEAQNVKNTSRFLALSFVLFFMSACTGDSLDPDCASSNLTITEANVVEATCGLNNGSVTFQATGGSGSLQYRVDGGNFSPNNRVNNLAPGEHIVTVKDVNDCISEVEFTIPTDILLNDIQIILNSNCAIPTCHNGSNANIPNWKDSKNTVANADAIKARVIARTMPPASTGLSLTNEEIGKIACWVDGGAPQ